MSKPKVFLSSTIYDFRDLRSALRVWLEEYGFEVLASDFNDFRQSPERNSYDSCLAAIDQADYFVLLVGGRVGGWYDQEKKISITRMEYQHANKRAGKGKLKLVAFVRKEVWDIREDRVALKRYLGEDAALDKELSDDQKGKLLGHPSKFVTDADVTFEFLAEIGKIEEMKKAVRGQGAYPTGNWIYQFTGFKDIIDALRTVMNVSGGLRRTVLVTNLKHEIEENCKRLFTVKDNGRLQQKSYGASFARQSFSGGMKDESTYQGLHLGWMGVFLTFWATDGTHMRSAALDEATLSGEFLDFDKPTGIFTVGVLQQGLLSLREKIGYLQKGATDEKTKVFGRELVANQQYKLNPDGVFRIVNYKMVVACHLYDLYAEVQQLLKAVYRGLDGDESLLLSAKSSLKSSLFEMSAEANGEIPDQTTIRSWLHL
ncbi:DUF4062 domain-containing protein [Gemmata sp. JC717]|uniref:DUF4062 domain-containing protein n=1 Tax=Gemmata algarum TaxID=2975278 RepID=UPI0021BAB1CB|nr:DUF4062 domain-containing protein [Gemmata algarum]MDY3554241.1 DUF4062 domain-containing protein [Gemmata algarum]